MTRRITGAVLEEVGRSRPFAESRADPGRRARARRPRLRRAARAHRGGRHLPLRPLGRRRQPAAPGADAARPRGRGHRRRGRRRGIRCGVLGRRPGRDGVPAAVRRVRRMPHRRRHAVRAGYRGELRRARCSTEAHGCTRDGDRVHHHLGVSGFATHAVVDHRSAVVVGHDVPPEVAAVLGCAVLTGGGAVVNAGAAKPGDDIVVVGLGGVGMAALITAVSLGYGRVIGVDAVPEKLDRARELGADAVYTPECGGRRRRARRARRGGRRPCARVRDRVRAHRTRWAHRDRRAAVVGGPIGDLAAHGHGRGTHDRRQLPRVGRALRGTSRATPNSGGRAASPSRRSSRRQRHARRHQRGDGHPRRRARHPADHPVLRPGGRVGAPAPYRDLATRSRYASSFVGRYSTSGGASDVSWEAKLHVDEVGRGHGCHRMDRVGTHGRPDGRAPRRRRA